MSSNVSTESLRSDFFGANPRRTLDEISVAEMVFCGIALLFFRTELFLDLLDYVCVVSMQPHRCVTMANITALRNKTTWYYICCKACNRKVYPYPDDFPDEKTPVWKCTTCNKDVTEVSAR